MSDQIEISDQLMTELLNELDKHDLRAIAEKIKASAHPESLFIHVPVIIDGVIDTLVFDVKEDRFTELRVNIATKGIIGRDIFSPLSKSAVLCDEYKTVVVKLPKE